MTEEPDNIKQVTNVVQKYVDACRTGDVELLKSVFHPDAQLVGEIGGTLLFGGPEPFFEAVAGAPSPQDAGTTYVTEISDVQTSGRVAQAILREEGYMGLSFTNYFQLLDTGDGWKITSKSFAHD